MSSPSQKVRHLFEAMLTGLLFGMQIICDAGVWMGIMSIPLLPYVFAVLTNEAYAEAFWINMECLFLRENSLIGNVITFAGVFVLLVALAQFLWSRHKGNKLVQSGLYSKMRHPQFTGIITINFGLTLLVGGVPALMYNLLLEKTTFWLIQVLGYIAIAKYEEWKLQKESGNDYSEYKRKVPFLFPIKSPKRISETRFTILITIIIWLILCFATAFGIK